MVAKDRDGAYAAKVRLANLMGPEASSARRMPKGDPVRFARGTEAQAQRARGLRTPASAWGVWGRGGAD